jgi:hypothetical protein
VDPKSDSCEPSPFDNQRNPLSRCDFLQQLCKKHNPPASPGEPAMRAGLRQRPYAVKPYDCGLATFDRKNMAPKQMRPAPSK